MRERNLMAMLAELVQLSVRASAALDSVAAGHGDRFQKVEEWQQEYRRLLAVWDTVCGDEGEEWEPLSPLWQGEKKRRGKRKESKRGGE